MNHQWFSVKEKLPKQEDADEKGYVMVYLRKDRQWGWPSRIGFGKWNRVTSTSHTHWAHCPKPPIEDILKETQAQEGGKE